MTDKPTITTPTRADTDNGENQALPAPGTMPGIGDIPMTTEKPLSADEIKAAAQRYLKLFIE